MASSYNYAIVINLFLWFVHISHIKYLHVNMQVYERLTESAANMNVTIQNRLFPSEFPIRELTSENFFVSY